MPVCRSKGVGVCPEAVQGAAGRGAVQSAGCCRPDSSKDVHPGRTRRRTSCQAPYLSSQISPCTPLSVLC